MPGLPLDERWQVRAKLSSSSHEIFPLQLAKLQNSTKVFFLLRSQSQISSSNLLNFVCVKMLKSRRDTAAARFAYESRRLIVLLELTFFQRLERRDLISHQVYLKMRSFEFRDWETKEAKEFRWQLSLSPKGAEIVDHQRAFNRELWNSFTAEQQTLSSQRHTFPLGRRHEIRFL